MRWTTELPTEPGCYWHSELPFPTIEGKGPFLVHVNQDADGVLHGWVPFMDFSEPLLLNEHGCFVGQWMGPIERPALP